MNWQDLIPNDIAGFPMSGVLGILSGLATLVILLTLLQTGFLNAKGKQLEKVLTTYARNLGAGEADDLANATPKAPTAFSKYRAKVDEQLAGAGITMPANVFIAGSSTIAVVIFVVSSIALGSPGLGAVLGMLIAYYLLFAFLPSRLKAKAQKFAEDLPQVLQIVASGLRAGLTFSSAISATALQDRGEVGRQFRRAIAEVQFGSNLEDALRRVADRMNSEDLRWLVMALEIQREVGGSLSGILDGVAKTIKSRADIQREIQVLSAEGRMSGYVLIALPIMAFLALVFIRLSYVAFFWTKPLGLILLGVVIALMFGGWIWMQKAVKVDA